MNLEKKNVHVLIYGITVIYLLYKILYKPSTEYVGAFVLIAGLNYLISGKIISSLLLAIVFCIVWEIIYPKKDYLKESMISEKIKSFEGFEDSTDDNNKDENNKDENKNDDEEDVDDNAIEEHSDGEGVTEPYLDIGRSFLEAYKNLSPKQIEGLTFDTKELLTTQQKLIETLNTIGPTLKEGKNILDTFKNYFVEDGK